MPTLNEKEREAFEAWYEPDADNWSSLRLYWSSDAGCYKHIAPSYLQGAWAGWKAASEGKAELVEAIKALLNERSPVAQLSDACQAAADLIAKHGA